MMRPVEVVVNWTTPPAPTGLTFTAGSVILNWTDTTPVSKTNAAVVNYLNPSSWDGDLAAGNGKTLPTQEVRFDIWRAPLSGPGAGVFVDIANVPANATTYTDLTVLEPTTTYEYRVTAWNQSGQSPNSNTITVNGVGVSQTALTNAPNPSAPGQNVTFTATVTSTTTGQPSGGTVQFREGVTVLGTSPLVGTTATFATTGLAVGDHTITAVYSGDSVFSTSTSPAVTQSVVGTGTTTALVSDLNPSPVGTTVTFTATVAQTGGTVVPTGSVEFFDGTVSLGTSLLVGSTATFTTASLTFGSHPITATYIPTGTFGPSTSSVVDQVVSRGATSATVTSSFNPAVFGANVTFTGVVTGSGTLTGTMQFLDGTTVLASRPVGTGTVTLSTLSLGNHPITVVYAGDSNFAGSTSAVLNQQVLSLSTTTVTSNRNPSTFGQSVTFTARVTPGPGTALVPGGTVQFMDGVNPIGTPITLNFLGRAGFTINTLPAASHAVTVVYSGDAFFLGSTSPAITQVVNKATAGVSLTTAPRTGNGRVGEAMTFTARVTPLTAALAGTVQFTIDPAGPALPFALSGVLALDATGRATSPAYTFVAPAGTAVITVVYSGNANFNPRTVNFNKVVEL